MSKGFNMFLGVVFVGMAVFLFVHDANYIMTGNLVDLNQILEEGGEIPRDTYVKYTCNYVFGNYGETQSYIGGIIPLPGKSQQFAFLGENDMIISAQISDKGKIRDMRQLADACYYNGDCIPVELVGCIQSNGGDMNRFLEQYFSEVDLNYEGLTMSPLVIDTTKTRLKITLTYICFALVGVAVFVSGLKKKNK